MTINNALSPTNSLERSQYYRKLTQTYTLDGFCKIKRHWEFLQTPSELSPSYYAVTMIVTGIVTGGASGRKTGQKIAKYFNLKSPNKEITEYGGMGIGMAVGGVSSGYAYMGMMEKTQHFQTWKMKCITNAIKEAATANYGEDGLLKNFLCPISQCIMLSPALSPTLTAYDCESLMNCGRTQDGKIKDPLNNKPFESSEIRDWYELGIVTNKRTLFLLQQDLSHLTDSSDSVTKEAVTNNVEIIKKSIKFNYESAKEQIEVRRREEVINNTQYMQEIKYFFDLFGAEYFSVIDWNRDWVSILDIRLKPNKNN